MKTELLHGYIIRITPYSDYDAILLLFTEEMGSLSVFVKGFVNSKKRFQGSLDRFLYNEFEVLIKGEDKLSLLKSSKIIDSFYQIKEEPIKLILSEHLVELYSHLLTQFTQHNFRYFDAMLRYINHAKELNYASLLILRFNVLKIAGIMPRVNSQNEHYFSYLNFTFLEEQVEAEMLYLTSKQLEFLLGFQEESQGILQFEFHEDERKSFGKLFSRMYYSISDKKLLTIPLLSQFF